MPLRERMAEIKRTIPAALQHEHVQMLTNPSSNGKKLKEQAKKSLAEFLKNEKFLDASVAATEKQLSAIPKAAYEDHDTLFKNIESLLKQCRQAQKIVAKNVADLEKLLKDIKKEFKIK